MPYYNIFKHLDFLTVDLGGITGQHGVDSVRKVFTSPQGTRFGVAICYESIYGEYFTEMCIRDSPNSAHESTFGTGRRLPQ